MDLAEFLQQLTDSGMGITGKHDCYETKYELRLCEDGDQIRVDWWPDHRQQADFPDNYGYVSLSDQEITTVEALHRAANGIIDAVTSVQDARLQEEIMESGVGPLPMPRLYPPGHASWDEIEP